MSEEKGPLTFHCCGGDLEVGHKEHCMARMGWPKSLESRPRPVVKKIAQVMLALKRLQRNGTHQQGWAYLEKDAVYEAVRGEMGKVGIAVFPNVVGVEQKDVKTSNNKSMIHTTVKVMHEFIDGDSGDSYAIEFPGESQDTDDGGIAKAVTASTKAMLIEVFKISAEDPTGQPRPQATQRPPQRTGAQIPPIKPRDVTIGMIRAGIENETKPPFPEGHSSIVGAVVEVTDTSERNKPRRCVKVSGHGDLGCTVSALFPALEAAVGYDCGFDLDFKKGWKFPYITAFQRGDRKNALGRDGVTDADIQAPTARK